MWLEGGSGALYAYTGGRPFDASRPCLVLIHGAQGDHSVWSLQSRYLAHHGCSVLAFDLPGHGRSPGPVETSVESYAERVAAALTGAGVRRALLAGHSMGSLIALELARRLKPSVAGIALVATAFPMRVSEPLLAAAFSDPPAAMDMVNIWSFSASIGPFLGRLPGGGPGSSVAWQNLRLMQQIAQRNGSEVLYRDLAACNAYRGGLEAVAAAGCPTLFVLSRGDQMTPPKAAQPLIDAAADGRVVYLGGTGHALMAEAPEGVREALWQFAQRCFAPDLTPAPGS
jgi:pimeloyl-ACP methyl ester carboxylesterase